MTTFTLSTHVIERANERGISIELIEAILSLPDRILDDESDEPNQKIDQSLIRVSEKGTYLVRVFVNCGVEPNVVKTVYRTSKTDKYL